MCSFGLASVPEPPKNFAKLRTLFQTAKFFEEKFRTFFSWRPTASRSLWPSFQSLLKPRPGSRRDLRPKSECKVRHFPRILQIFRQEIYAQKHVFTTYPAPTPGFQPLQRMLKINTCGQPQGHIIPISVLGSVRYRKRHIQRPPPEYPLSQVNRQLHPLRDRGQ